MLNPLPAPERERLLNVCTRVRCLQVAVGMVHTSLLSKRRFALFHKLRCLPCLCVTCARASIANHSLHQLSLAVILNGFLQIAKLYLSSRNLATEASVESPTCAFSARQRVKHSPKKHSGLVSFFRGLSLLVVPFVDTRSSPHIYT